MAKAIIHVHQQNLRKNLPSLIVRTYRGSQHFSRVEINGPSVLVHSPEPDHCGARLWIEADTADLVCDGEPFSLQKHLTRAPRSGSITS